MCSRGPVQFKVASDFWKSVEWSVPGTCWNWTGGPSDQNAYGRFQLHGKQHLTHRFSYELHYGPIPRGLHILHACDNPRCVRPDHLSVGTHEDNMRDRRNKKRAGVRLTTGLVGHARRRVRAGESIAAVARNMGVHHATMHQAVRGEHWTDVAEPPVSGQS